MTPLDSDRDPRELYRERVQRIADASALKETDRVPYIYTARFWNAMLAGFTCEETMCDVEKSISSTRQAICAKRLALRPRKLSRSPSLAIR